VKGIEAPVDGRRVPRSADRGSAAVEFAMVLPLLLLLVFGIIDFGRMLNAKITLNEAAREGARSAALQSESAGIARAATLTADIGTTVGNTGTADLLTFDDYMNPLPSLNLTRTYTAASLAIAPGTNKLVIPNRFAGPVQGSKVFISQADFQNVATHVMSLVNLSSGTPAVSSY